MLGAFTSRVGVFYVIIQTFYLSLFYSIRVSVFMSLYWYFFCLSLFILYCITGFATLFIIKSKWHILHLYKRVGVVYVTKAYLMSTIANAQLVVIIAIDVFYAYIHTSAVYAYIHTSTVYAYIHTSTVDMLYSIQRWLLVCFTAHQVCFLFFTK